MLDRFMLLNICLGVGGDVPFTEGQRGVGQTCFFLLLLNCSTFLKHITYKYIVCVILYNFSRSQMHSNHYWVSCLAEALRIVLYSANMVGTVDRLITQIICESGHNERHSTLEVTVADRDVIWM